MDMENEMLKLLVAAPALVAFYVVVAPLARAVFGPLATLAAVLGGVR